jgi:hypothetical protein
MIEGTEARRYRIDLHVLEHVSDGLIMLFALGFPTHVLFKIELGELQNCTSAYVLLQQVNEFYLVYRFQVVALNLLAVYDVETNNKVSLQPYAISFHSALYLCTTLSLYTIVKTQNI